MISLENGVVLPWADEGVREDVETLEKSVYRLFATAEGSVLWHYLQRTILNTAVAGDDTKSTLEYMNGKRALALHLKSLATRGKKA